MIDKGRVFEKELSWIECETVRKFAAHAIELLPDYYFTVPASSTGRFHPSYALGDGGLVRHTKAAVAIANDLLSLEMYGKYSEIERSCILGALILHDGLKHGHSYSKYTIAEHPTVAADWIDSLGTIRSIPNDNIVKILTDAIRSHMGQWNTDYKTKKEIMPKPHTAVQKFVHMCDYLASRKYLEFDFGDDYYKPEDYQVAEEIIDPLKSTIDEILALCKQRVAGGSDKEGLFKLIADNNNGNKNPNSITDIDAATNILAVIRSNNNTGEEGLA